MKPTPPRRRPGHHAQRHSNWWALRMQPQRMASALQQKYWLRLHGLCMGLLVLLVMWAVSASLLHAGVQSMALRYAASLGLGYIVYLLVLRLWAAFLVRHAAHKRKRDDSIWNNADVSPSCDWFGDAGQPAQGCRPSGNGGSAADASDASSSWVDGIDVGSIDVGADEGIVIVPILAVFAGLVMALFGLGALLWLYFGVDVLLGVAVELAFSMMAARAMVRVERAGWLAAAVRLTWKPLLGALVCAVALGALADWWFPEATTMRQVLVHIRG